MYRKFVEDNTWEISEDPTRNPPFKVYEFISNWEPARDPDNGVPAGLSILTGEPCGPIRPVGFVEGFYAALEAVVDQVKAHWGALNSDYVEQWLAFLQTAPCGRPCQKEWLAHTIGG